MTEDKIVKITMNENRLFVEGEQYSYIQGAIRTLQFECCNISYVKNYSRGIISDNDSFSETHHLSGTAKLEKDTINIIGNNTYSTDKIYITIQPIKENKTSKEVMKDVSIFFLSSDWEIGNDDEWCLCVYIIEEKFNELLESYKIKSLKRLTLGVDADLWIREFDYHAPPSCPIAWYLRPDEEGNTSRPELSKGHLTNLTWHEHPAKLTFDEEADNSNGDCDDTDEAREETGSNILDKEPSNKKHSTVRNDRAIFWALIFIGIAILLH